MAEEKKKEKKKRPTAVKRDIQSKKRCAANRAFKSAMRTRIRSLREKIGGQDKDAVQKELNEVYSILDKGVQSGVIKLNKASRSKHRLATQAQK